MAERFPLQVTVLKVASVSFAALARPALGAPWELPSIPGLPLYSGPVQLHTSTHQLVPATVRQEVPGPLGAPGQVVSLSPVVHFPWPVQLPPCPAYGWGQQLVTGVLLPHQPRAVVQGEPLYPTGSGVLCAHHQPALAGRTTMEPKVVTTPAPRKPTDLPEEGPATSTEAIPEQAGDTTNHHLLAQPETPAGEDTIVNAPNSPTLSDLLDDLFEYLADSGCPEEQVEVAQEDSDDTTLAANAPSLTAEDLDELLEFCECLLEDDCPKEPAMEAQQRNSEDAVLTTPNLTSSLSPLRDPRPPLPRMAQLGEETMQKQPQVVKNHLQLPPGITTIQVDPKTREVAAARPRARRQPAPPRNKGPSPRATSRPRKRRRQR
ncbi:proteoglycan 4-like [Chiroxiphia lanceolata]|uniref:proteoglycan 4-like n=1 Tax=Chiroxiphia lanceolata TaxID=296741 RepID=UPI0013CE63DD|nr:proteoglycan 4-like [Chiroxiphia lanceolata]